MAAQEPSEQQTPAPALLYLPIAQFEHGVGLETRLVMGLKVLTAQGVVALLLLKLQKKPMGAVQAATAGRGSNTTIASPNNQLLIPPPGPFLKCVNMVI